MALDISVFVGDGGIWPCR